MSVKRVSLFVYVHLKPCQKTKIMAYSPITSGQIDGEKMEAVTGFVSLDSFLGLTVEGDCSHGIQRLAPWMKSYDKPWQRIKKQRHHFANKSP